MILVTLGDPYSCNTELLAKVLDSYQPTEPVALIGSHAHWTYQLEKLKIKGPAFSAVHHQIEDGWTPGFYFVDVGIKTKDQDARHITEKERGEIAFQSLEFARNFLTKRGRHADIKLLTAPIEKKACARHSAGSKPCVVSPCSQTATLNEYNARTLASMSVVTAMSFSCWCQYVYN